MFEGVDAAERSKRVWVTGAQGFLGSEIVKSLGGAGYQVVGTDKELTVTDTGRLEAFATEVQPGTIINCAGVPRDATSLSTRIKAYEINALGAMNVALVANTVGAKIIQISTDDVYASQLSEPVNEFDNPHPDTPYGKSKRAGEVMVRDTAPDHVIVRSSWLYSADGGQLKRVLDAAQKGTTIEMRTDQFAAPTSIALYMDVIKGVMPKNAHGTFHIATIGKASRYDFAAKALEIAGYNPSNVLIPTEDAKTAENLVLESLMLEMLGADIPTWEDALESYMQEAGLTA